MAELPSDWSIGSNDAVTVSLVTPSQGDATSKTIGSFHPKFTYSIFGDEESIFGYQGLKIHLKYHASDMRPSLQVTYNKKFKAQGEVEPADVKTILEDFLPKTAFDKSAVFEKNLKDDLTTQWKPPGELLTTIEPPSSKLDGKVYEIWKGNLADKAVQQLMNRIQILVPFFIEGGTLIDLSDPDWSLERWTVFFMYTKDQSSAPGVSPYTFVGYSTVYRYYLFRLPTPLASPQKFLDFELPLDMSISDTPSRSRISQFIILPTSQATGAGSKLYSTIFKHYQAESSVVEITVEDPNEQFDDLRDYNDLTRLRTIPSFASLRLNHSTTVRAKGPVPSADLLNISPSELEILRLAQKIAPRQFGRLVEMQLLSLIHPLIRQSLLPSTEKLEPDTLKKGKREYYLWQLLAKQRLYRHNKQMLMQLDRVERIEKLEEALGGVEADYARLLRRLDAKVQGNGGNATYKGGKRSAEDMDDYEEESGEGSSKKARVEDER